MKRFTNDRRNDQEGRESIPAQRREEEAPLGVSFEGGLTAEPRRYSRRQAIGLLGGSLAGASLASLGLVAPAKSQSYELGIPPFRSYDHIALEWFSTPVPIRSLEDAGTPVPFQSTPQNRFLDGRTHNITVGLAPHTGTPFTGTRWEVHVWGAGPDPNLVHLKCLGHIPGVRWLRGFPFRPPNGTVGLDGRHSLWRVHKLPK